MLTPVQAEWLRRILLRRRFTPAERDRLFALIDRAESAPTLRLLRKPATQATLIPLGPGEGKRPKKPRKKRV